MIQKSEQQDIDLDGRRLLDQALAPLRWVLNRVDDDYGIDYDVQVFVEGNAHGLWFKVQLKSSASSEISTEGSFISQQLSLDHANYYAFRLREPLFLIHADTKAKKVYWHAPQLDNELIDKLARGINSSTVTVRVPTSNSLPDTAPGLLEVIDKLSVVLANRTLANSSVSSFAESLKYQPGEDKLREEFQLRSQARVQFWFSVVAATVLCGSCTQEQASRRINWPQSRKPCPELLWTQLLFFSFGKQQRRVNERPNCATACGVISK